MKKSENWVVLNKKAEFKEIGAKYGVDQVIARIARNRDVIEPQELEMYFRPSLLHLNDPSLLKGAGQAVQILKNKIEQKKKIRIIGDYDIDGIFSAYILYDGLSKLGAVVDYELPHRINDGYGLSRKLIEQAVEDGCDTILTCDNGIAAAQEIQYAKEKGLTVIVTDHHEVPFIQEDDHIVQILPPADAVVDPKQDGCAYPCKGICGAVVAWKVLQLLMQTCGHPDEWKTYLEYAAFATIGDVMELRGENRVIVSLGLESLRNTNNIGLQALIDKNQLDAGLLRAYHIGFVLGPCMNASGRLDTAKRALALLLEQNKAQAAVLAEELVSLNTSRKELTQQGLDLAIDSVERDNLLTQPVLVVYLPDCHESLAGIIAGKLRERYYRPTFVLTSAEGCVKGSGRSIPGFSMYEKMSRIGHLFLKFGGHPMAAGLSLEEDNVERFRQEINVDTGLTETELTEKICIDVKMPLEYITEQLVDQLDVLEPCGNGNEKPVFAESGLRARRAQYIGKERNMLKLQLELRRGTMDALYFGDAEEFLDYYRGKYGVSKVDALLSGRKQDISFSFTYYPQINEYQGYRSVQIVISHYC